MNKSNLASLWARDRAPSSSPAASADTSRNVVMTTYFCRKIDPQKKIHAPPDDFDYIAPWYTSMHSLGLNGVVFHDGMSADFIERHQTSKIRFEFVDPAEFTYSLNDYRYFIYLRYLQRNPHFEHVFMTDGNDVTVVQDPFKGLRRDRIYVGSETGNFRENKWIQRRVYLLNKGARKYRFDRPWRRAKTIYNAGILGGTRDRCLEFLRAMVDTLESLELEQRNLNLNMVVFNYVVYEHFRRKAVTGEPVHSVFTGFENERKDVWFIHK